MKLKNDIKMNIEKVSEFNFKAGVFNEGENKPNMFSSSLKQNFTANDFQMYLNHMFFLS